jgi:hypothetical protein
LEVIETACYEHESFLSVMPRQALQSKYSRARPLSQAAAGSYSSIAWVVYAIIITAAKLAMSSEMVQTIGVVVRTIMGMNAHLNC